MNSQTHILRLIEPTSVCFLIPKKRGNGFLACPVGHHMTPTVRRLTEEIPDYNIYGLDGYLWVEMSSTWKKDDEIAHMTKVISDIFGFPWKDEDRQTWWSHLTDK